MTRQRCRGLTLLELISGIAIVAILSSLAVSSFNPLLTRLRQDAAIQHLVASLSRARTLAVTRAENITLCSMSPASECSTAWDQHYLGAFIDSNSNWSRDASEEILFQQPWNDSGIHATWVNFRTHPLATYQPDGTILSNGTVSLYERGNEPFAKIVINVLGRARIERL